MMKKMMLDMATMLRLHRQCRAEQAAQAEARVCPVPVRLPIDNLDDFTILANSLQNNQTMSLFVSPSGYLSTITFQCLIQHDSI